MDTMHLLSVMPTAVAIAAAAFTGAHTAHKFLKATCQIVYLLGSEPLENAEKRKAAVKALYQRFPVMARVIPDYMLGKLVDIAWNDVIKPTATQSTP